MNIEIPDDINQLSLAIQDRIALATMRKRPRIGNGALAKLLGLSDSGVRTLIRRLKASGLVREINIEGKREFKVLVGSQNNGSLTRRNVTQTGTQDFRQKLTPSPPADWTPQQRGIWWGQHFKKRFDFIYGNLVRANHPGMCAHYAAEFGKLAEEIRSCDDMPVEAWNLLLRVVEHQRNHQAAGEFINQHVQGDEAEHAWLRLRKATPEQLSTFYQRLQGGQLQGGNDPMLLGDGVG